MEAFVRDLNHLLSTLGDCYHESAFLLAKAMMLASDQPLRDETLISNEKICDYCISLCTTITCVETAYERGRLTCYPCGCHIITPVVEADALIETLNQNIREARDNLTTPGEINFFCELVITPTLVMARKTLEASLDACSPCCATVSP